MFAWGENSISGCLGLGSEVISPTELPGNLTSDNVKVLAPADNQCCVLSSDGSVYSFGAVNGGSFESNISRAKVTAFETLNIVDIFAGGRHMFAVTDDGRAYGWGVNLSGQLGWKDNSGNMVVSVPKIVRLQQSKRVVQISCGQEHSLVLLNDGSIYSMGDNSYGQLGIGTSLSTSQPTEISSLRGLPITQVVASGWHSFCVTVSGRVFCWGRNDFGQLGLGDRENRKSPCLLKMLRSQAVKFVAAGDHHTAVLTKDGGVFTFGSSDKGQLGHDTISEFEVNPRKVFELMGSVVTQVACGKRHTIAFVPGSKQIFACGSGAVGQLGQGQKIDSLKVPTIVKGPWQVQSDVRSFSGSFYNIKQVAASGNQSFVMLCSSASESAIDFRSMQTHRRIWSMSSTLCERISAFGAGVPVPVEVVSFLECVMSSQNCINASFLAADHHKTSTKYSGLNLMKARLLLAKILQCGNRRLLQKIETCLCRNLLPSLMPNPPDIEALRLYLILPELKLFHDSDHYNTLLFPFVDKLLRLSENPSKILDQWYRSLDPDFFITPVKMCQKCVVETIRQRLPRDEFTKKVTLILNFMQKLNRVNDSCDTALIDFRKFYIPELTDRGKLESDHQNWLGNPTDFSFCRYPFVFNSKAKTILLQADARLQMTQAFMQARDRNMAAFFGFDPEFLESPVIEVEINRDNLVMDALRHIGSIRNFKRPFMVKFVGEDGQDAGGVRKEFFMLILREVLNPKYGMFRHYKDSGLLWFSDYEIETDEMYHLIGTLCGLAVYNSTIMNINFPLALYKKLLGVQATLSDLKELDPLLGNGLQQLLDYVEEDGDTIEETFGLNFSTTREVFGEITTVNLIENGANIAVTSENRNQYLHAYLDYVFNRSIRSQFEGFCRGFLRVCGGEIMNLFRPEELMEMVVGNQNYNWEELEKKTVYKGDYYRNHQVIVWFWEVFHSLKTEEKKDFVRFLTGSSKIPINGLEFIIQPLPFSDDYLPVAHTCFNVLDLPRYSSKETLSAKLKLAIKSEGFYLA